jgi:hypothetical protein
VTRRHATAAVACAVAAVLGAHCASISGDATAPLAIEFVFPRFTGRFTVEEFDTVPISVRVLDRAGDSLAGAGVRVISFNPETLFVDTQPLRLIGKLPGTARLLATSGSLQGLDTVNVVRAPDSLALASGAADTFDVKTTDTASAPLEVSLLDLRTTPGQALTMSGYRVVFAIVQPPFASPAAAAVLFGNDTVPTLVDTVTTAGGVASAILKRHGPPPQPDSVIVQASAKRANGTVVPGSPIQFIVRFR